MVRWFDDVYSEEGPFWSTFEHRTFATPWKNLPSQGSFEMPWLQPKRCGDVSTSGPIVTSRCFPQTYCMICMYFCIYVFFTNSRIVIYIYVKVCTIVDVKEMKASVWFRFHFSGGKDMKKDQVSAAVYVCSYFSFVFFSLSLLFVSHGCCCQDDHCKAGLKNQNCDAALTLQLGGTS